MVTPGLCPCRALVTSAGMRNGSWGLWPRASPQLSKCHNSPPPPPPPLAGDPSQRSPNVKAHSPSSLRGLPKADSPDEGRCCSPPPIPTLSPMMPVSGVFKALHGHKQPGTVYRCAPAPIPMMPTSTPRELGRWGHGRHHRAPSPSSSGERMM